MDQNTMDPKKEAFQLLLQLLKDNKGELDIEKLTATAIALTSENKPVRVPENHITPNSKLANIVQDPEVYKDTEGFKMRTSGRKSKKDIDLDTYVSFDGDPNILIRCNGRPYTEYDRQVHDAVVSLVGIGVETFTPAMVYRAMNGMSDDGISQKAIDEIDFSLEKICVIRVKLNVREELKARGLEYLEPSLPLSNGWLRDYLLDLQAIDIEYKNNNGTCKVSGYRLGRTPPLYWQSQILGQIINTPTKYFCIKDKNGRTLRNNSQRIAIKGYLSRRIGIMKGKTATSNRILLSSIYELFEPTKDRKKLQRYRNYAIEVLTFWQSEGYIKGFTIVADSGVDRAFDIVY